jgi:hypothetical protein
MNRRQFFQRMGWGAGGLLIAPSVFGAAWSESWDAESLAAFAVACAREAGASYADAHVGDCIYHGDRPLAFLRSELLGMRICGPEGWHHVLLHDNDRDTLRRHIQTVLATPIRTDSSQRQHWQAAVFFEEQVHASASSDPQVAAQLQSAWLRYPQPLALPASNDHILFCDALLIQ